MFQNKKLKRNATYAIAEVALCASNCALSTSVKLHVALARISLAATVYAYIYIFTFLNRFVCSLLQCCKVTVEVKGVEGFYGESESKKDFAGVGSQSRTEINPGIQSRSWSRTEKMAESQSRTNFASTLQNCRNHCDISSTEEAVLA